MRVISKKKVDIKFIKQLRLDQHFSQVEVAKGIGLNSSDKYNRRENGDYNFRPEELQALSELLNVPMEKFFTKTV